MYMQRKRFNLYSIWTFNQNGEHLGFCFMIMKLLFENIIFLSAKKIFEMSLMQNIVRYLPQHVQ